ncbi:MAG: hypothetical protein V4843_12495 [Pseudomonadota bacterium]
MLWLRSPQLVVGKVGAKATGAPWRRVARCSSRTRGAETSQRGADSPGWQISNSHRVTNPVACFSQKSTFYITRKQEGTMATRKKLKIYFSGYFGVNPTALAEYGAFDISLINDLPLFLDPFLLFNSDKSEYRDLHDEMIRYMIFLKNQSSTTLPRGLLKSWFFFPEVKQNWMGFSKSGNNGRGLGADFASSLKINFSKTFQSFGDEQGTHTHLGKLTLIKNGVGKDQISDFTCNLIKGYLAEYTQNFAKKHINPKNLGTFMVDKVAFNYKTESWSSKQFTLPKLGNDYVLLTPIDILTKDDAWISHNGFVEDFSSVVACVDNDELRGKVENYLAKQLPIEPNKADREKAIEIVVAKYPELLDIFVKMREDASKQATQTSAEKIAQAQELFVANLTQLIELLEDKTRFFKTPTSSYEEGMKRVKYLQHVIEKQDGYRLFYVKGKPISRESDLQIMFKLTWFASDFSADAEVNNGRGPADFIVSYGSGSKTAIEFKLAKNSQLEKNLLHQAEIYADASRTTTPPIKAILYFSLKELFKVQQLLIKHGLNTSKDIVLIDATVKDSASKADNS